MIVTADVFVFRTSNDADNKFGLNGQEVLLIRRNKNPHISKWTLPGGPFHVDLDLTITQTASRKLQEDTGLSILHSDLKYLFYKDAPNRDPRGRYITHVFIHELKEDPKLLTYLQANNDADQIQWMPFKDIQTVDFAFDHKLIVKEIIANLESQI